MTTKSFSRSLTGFSCENIIAVVQRASCSDVNLMENHVGETYMRNQNLQL